jgi:hypothetical protein
MAYLLVTLTWEWKCAYICLGSNGETILVVDDEEFKNHNASRAGK